MNSLTWRRFGIRLRLLTPGALTLAAVFVSVVPVGLSGLPEVTPFFALMAVYHWSIYRPELLPAPVVFVLGLAQDGLTGGPLGLFALILIVVYGLVSTQRGHSWEGPFRSNGSVSPSSCSAQPWPAG